MFIFEIIQNADANNYSRAKAFSADPYIKFIVHLYDLVIECNEDWFTPDDIKTLCIICERTKTKANAPYSIGETEAKFKSVFIVASKVYIQSKPFLFPFEYKPGD